MFSALSSPVVNNHGTIRADQTRLRQSLLNLASNANKFTKKGTMVAHQGQ
jgi:signal transduction histidine kinase